MRLMYLTSLLVLGLASTLPNHAAAQSSFSPLKETPIDREATSEIQRLRAPTSAALPANWKTSAAHGPS